MSKYVETKSKKLVKSDLREHFWDMKIAKAEKRSEIRNDEALDNIRHLS